MWCTITSYWPKRRRLSIFPVGGIETQFDLSSADGPGIGVELELSMWSVALNFLSRSLLGFFFSLSFDCNYIFTYIFYCNWWNCWVGAMATVPRYVKANVPAESRGYFDRLRVGDFLLHWILFCVIHCVLWNYSCRQSTVLLVSNL